MLILSFDIGIKNLAYSICNIEGEGKIPTSVIEWDVINLIKDKQATCPAPKYNDANAICGNNSKLCIGRGDKRITCCSNKSCQKWTQHKWTSLYPKSKATIGKFKQKKATTYSLIDMGVEICNWLKTMKEKQYPIDAVLLEHQPVMKNPVMKSIEMILVGALLGTNFSKNIYFVLASGKTKQKDDNSTYKNRKQNSISLIETWKQSDTSNTIFSTEIWNLWETSKKKDDLADTVCQAIYWFGVHSST